MLLDIEFVYLLLESRSLHYAVARFAKQLLRSG